MNGSGKQSFYEIQLSNSSLVVAFVIAVLLGIAVFVLGVMVGRGQAPELVVDDPWVEQFPAESADATAGAVDLPTGELSAFGDVEQPVQGGAEAPADTTAAAPDAEEEELSPIVEESLQAAPTPPEGLPANDPALASGWVVQVKATANRDEADELQAALAGAGFPAFVVSEQTRGERLHKVRVGRYRTRDDATRVQAVLAARGDVGDTWVTEG